MLVHGVVFGFDRNDRTWIASRKVCVKSKLNIAGDNYNTNAGSALAYA